MAKQKRATMLLDWEKRFAEQLPLFGHRNWIVIADSAYPAQASPGIETVFAAGDPLAAMRKVVARVNASRHLHANIYIDRELEFISEDDAPGITLYRQQLAQVLRAGQPQALPHEQIIARLDEYARMFRVLIVKTELALPYTSVFMELGCGYWSAEAEERLRKTMHNTKQRVSAAARRSKSAG